MTVSLFEALLAAELLGECCIAASAAEWFNGRVTREAVVDGLRSRGGNNLGKGLLKEVAQHHATGMVEATGHHATVYKHPHLIAQGIAEHAVVVVATVRALKMHGGAQKQDLATENLQALENGIPNLLRHVSNVKNVYGLPCVVAINRFPTDTDAEIKFVVDKCNGLGVNTVLSTVWADGSKGGEALAKEVVRLCEEEKGNFAFAYDDCDSITQKIEKVVRKVYGGQGVSIAPAAQKQIAKLEQLGFSNMPVCIAKTQYSFSDDPTLLGAPEGFTVGVKNVKVSAGAGFIVVLTGEIMTMPGLPKSPSAERIDVTDDGKIVGLF